MWRASNRFMASQTSSVRVTLSDFETNLRLGVHPWERHQQRPTRLLVSVELDLSLTGYYREAGGYLDYDPVRAFLASWADRPHTDHIETLAEDLLDFLFANTVAARATIRLTKPDIFNDVGGVGVTYAVTREDWTALRQGRP